MITQIRQPEGNEPGQDQVVQLAQDDTAVQEDKGQVLDAYAAAELTRRHERTESMIRKAHEQFL